MDTKDLTREVLELRKDNVRLFQKLEEIRVCCAGRPGICAAERRKEAAAIAAGKPPDPDPASKPASWRLAFIREAGRVLTAAVAGGLAAWATIQAAAYAARKALTP